MIHKSHSKRNVHVNQLLYGICFFTILPFDFLSATETPFFGLVQLKTVMSNDFHKVKKFSPQIILADAATALCIATAISIPISLIDAAIMRKVSGQVQSVGKEFVIGMKTAFFRPQKFFLPCKDNFYFPVFRLVTTVYGFTYLFGNVTRSFCEAYNIDRKWMDLALLTNTAVINTVLTVWKDTRMLQLFGGKASYVPRLTQILCAIRDTLTCLAAFVLVDRLAMVICAYSNKKTVKAITNDEETEPKMTMKKAKQIASFITPTSVQFISTPIHITAIMYKNMYPNCTAKDITTAIKANYASATSARIGRISFAFSVGGVGNLWIRHFLQEAVEGPE